MRFSIIIPTRNRVRSLDRCLASLARLEYLRDDFEVIVVDDGSEPRPTDVLTRHAVSLALRSLRREGNGPAAARNAGLALAQGEIVVFTDDDCTPRADWLRAFDAAAHASAATAFGGRILDSPENNMFGRSSQMLVTFLYAWAEAKGTPAFFCSNNLAMPREPLVAMGGFDESFPLPAAEDRDLCARWAKQGRLQYLAEAVIEHRQELNLRTFWRQQFRYGQGAFHYWQRRQDEGLPGNRLESLRFYRAMLLSPFGRMAFAEAVVCSTLLALSQCAVAAGYFTERGTASAA